jgi:UDP-N-acetylmuramoyl-tripeptide--D-alanyl-D-alanine ligase
VETRTLAFIASACDGELVQGSPQTSTLRVCTDSRRAQAGDLFFAIKGDQFDGHDFLNEVARKGVAAVVVERGPKCRQRPACGVIVVDNPRAALGRLAAAYRSDFALAIVAIGGSNGKTTTKDLVAAVLRQKLRTLWSEASFNNDIGVPLTLLRLERAQQAAVLEVGTNHPGELAPLVKMIRPQYGVITHIGREHLEFFGDVAGVAKEEGMLAELLPADGKLFLNGDNEWTNAIARRTGAPTMRVGLTDGNDWRVRSLRPDKQGATFRVEAPRAGHGGEYRIRLLGRHQVVNALFAIAVGAELGLDRAEIQRGLAECEAAKMRLQLWEIHGVRVLDDAYNANADSMLAALQVLQQLPCKGRRVAVLGDMAELGAHSQAAHAEVGRRAAELGVGQLFAIGKMAPVMAQAARAAGLNRVIELADVESAVPALKSFLKTGDVVLLKASRATRLERVAAALRGNGNGKKS